MQLRRVQCNVRAMMLIVAAVGVSLALVATLRSGPTGVEIVNVTGHRLYDARMSCPESREDWTFGQVEPGAEIRCKPVAPNGAFAVFTYSLSPRGPRVKHLIRLGTHARVHITDPTAIPGSGAPSGSSRSDSHALLATSLAGRRS